MGRQPPLVDDSIGPQNLAIITPIFSLGILLFVLRIYTRVTPIYKLNASDYTNAVAVVAQVLTYSFFAAAVGNGFGRHNHFLTPESTVKISKLLFGVVFVGLWASTFARVSMACLLLQFHDLRSIMWKVALWFTIGLQVVTLFASEAFQLLECRPLRRMWEEVPDAQCVSPQDAWVVGYLFVGTLLLKACLGTAVNMCLDGTWPLCNCGRGAESHLHEDVRFHISRHLSSDDAYLPVVSDRRRSHSRGFFRPPPQSPD
ncbi:hypothetical protein BGZ61DRAFT_567588 [Ilyonectria robusta]|uniref:uncharacterized protein n=1 Tax=Ilyonectria robusta TaxID=1079257 RepID=UPI001E8DA83B|nr:uncharacterized protein BGZ61DRAFT_567588 [Ilyonectria robusta]KAH8658552.1 hypothetical protein BGZ61DRAFT_567588 [Ilyonectria robusta]